MTFLSANSAEDEHCNASEPSRLQTAPSKDITFFVKQTVDLIPTGALHPPPNLELLLSNFFNLVTRASLGSSRFNTAPIVVPISITVGKSFNECTIKSTVPLSKATSRSLVNKLFSPIFGRGLSKTLSPIVVIETISNSISGFNSFNWLITNLVWINANSLLREPTRIVLRNLGSVTVFRKENRKGEFLKVITILLATLCTHMLPWFSHVINILETFRYYIFFNFLHHERNENHFNFAEILLLNRCRCGQTSKTNILKNT
ncbi:hypothetical protein AGLY_012790 [Aphis glycines]|uniref:Uncharacterized protein n=1 Tax=Aphis glycines TaxID=307491 RepID=A0A6G0T910_APHGL|nr:hypothetical protein AGLY_012790 [Aphis glycines]